MHVRGLDHINIIAADLDETARFYESLLGLRVGRPPNVPAGFDGRWLHDASDRPIIHVMPYNEARHGKGARSSMPTGSIDHIALACEDFDGTRRRCEELDVGHRVNDRAFGDLRQIFVTDPNNVVLELNFAGD